MKQTEQHTLGETIMVVGTTSKPILFMLKGDMTDDQLNALYENLTESIRKTPGFENEKFLTTSISNFGYGFYCTLNTEDGGTQDTVLTIDDVEYIQFARVAEWLNTLERWPEREAKVLDGMKVRNCDGWEILDLTDDTQYSMGDGFGQREAMYTKPSYKEQQEYLNRG
jgi:hypothetical protein